LEELNPIRCYTDRKTLDTIGIGVMVASESALHPGEETFAKIFVAVLGLLAKYGDSDEIGTVVFRIGIINRQIEVADSFAILRFPEFGVFGQATNEVNIIHGFFPSCSY
jgi:hypothetical protein